MRRRIALEASAPDARRHVAAALTSLSAGDGILQADGTLWSHAATLGTRVKGDPFTIDQATVENFVHVFSSGYPQKVPVDYDHASTSPDPEIRKLRAQGQVPKAGDVLELKGVFAAADFTGALKTAAEQLATKAGRALDDPRNYGLWMRWKPTSRALQRIKDGEYSELSITFDDDWPDNSTGTGQGPTIIAVALTNLPFLDDMLPVAASRLEPAAADPRSLNAPERTMTQKLTVLSVVAAMLGKAVSTDDEALTELQALQPQLKSMREYNQVIVAELGESDPLKAVAKIREYRTSAETAQRDAAEQKKAAIKSTVENTVKEYEKALTVPLREMMVRQLTGELEAGKKLEDSETLKTLKSLKPLGITERASGADDGSSSATSEDDEKLDAKAKELMQSDPEVKAMYAREGFSKAFRLALTKADKLLGAKTA
ncbi:MAG TPA: phage protease [Gemmatimonadaceae bacterium]|nr:phage protease [Gemmatimonadaceae bacterium]